jgi:hypothetical protein
MTTLGSRAAISTTAGTSTVSAMLMPQAQTYTPILGSFIPSPQFNAFITALTWRSKKRACKVEQPRYHG